MQSSLVSLSMIILDSALAKQPDEVLKAWARFVNTQAGVKEPRGTVHNIKLALKGRPETYTVHTGACVMGGEDTVDLAENYIDERVRQMQLRQKRSCLAVVTSMSHPDDPGETIKAWGVHGDLKSEWRPTEAQREALLPMAGKANQGLALLKAVMPWVIDVPSLALVRGRLQTDVLEQHLPRLPSTVTRKQRM